MPQDALEYFISVHNSCHDNGGHSWIQQIEDAGVFARGWVSYALEHRITATQYGYSGQNSMPAQEWKWVQRRMDSYAETDKFGSENAYLHAKQVHQFLVKHNLWQEVKEFSNEWCDFTNPMIPSHVVITCLYVAKNYLSKIKVLKDDDHLWMRALFIQIMLFVTPVVSCSDAASHTLPVHLLPWQHRTSELPPVAASDSSVPNVS